MEKTILILVAHGSRLQAANDEVEALSKALEARQKTAKVVHAFLDTVAKPNIPETIDRCIARGAQRIVVVPYFLNTGNHVQNDIPAIIDVKRLEHPAVKIELKEHLGTHDGVIDLLEKILNQ